MTKKSWIILSVNTLLGILLLAGTAVYSVMTGKFGWGTQTIAYGVSAACLLCVPICLAIKKQSNIKESVMKLAFVIMICASVLIPIMMLSKSVLHLDTAEDVKNFVLSTGAWGMLIYVLLQVLQVVILPLPAFICYGAGTLLYSAWLATLLASVGVIIGSVICFAIGRVFGFKVVSWIAGKEQTIKYSEMFGQRGKVLFIMMQLLPFFPDDLMCMVAGLTSMKWVFFLCVIFIIRPLVIAVYCFGFELIPFDQAWGIAVWVVIIVVCVVLGIVAYKYQDRIEKWIKKKFGGAKPEPEDKDETVPVKGVYTEEGDPSESDPPPPAATGDTTPDPDATSPPNKPK